MSPLFSLLSAVLLAYAIGGIPFGYLVARWVRGIDIREHGSKNIGATNVGRVLGAKWGILVLLLDIVKALLPTWLLPLFLVQDPTWSGHAAITCGVAAILGHMYPCWLLLRGGKGVASALGVVAYLSPWCTLVAVGIFAASFGIWRIVSLSSIMAASAFAISHVALFRDDLFSAHGWSLTAFSFAVPLLIVARHRANIGRLLKGQEPRYVTGSVKPTPKEV